MLNEQFQQAIELSKQLIAIFQSMDIAADNSTSLLHASQLLQQRDKHIKSIFSSQNQQELIDCQLLLKEFMEYDAQLQKVSSVLKLNMSNKIIQQKRKTKATQAYIQK